MPRPKEPASVRLARTRSKHQRPPTCAGCPLESIGKGFVPPSGPEHAPIAFVGESPWIDELHAGFGFAGAAGSMLHRVLRRNSWERDTFRLANTYMCAPPSLDGPRPWLQGALAHCSQHLDPVLNEPHKVIVPMGGLAIRRLLNLWGPNVQVDHFHGTVSRDPLDRFWIVPTYHPSYLQRGAVNMIGVSSFDLRRAHEVALHGWEPDRMTLVLDPPIEWFGAWAEMYLAAVAQDPENVWLAVDIETPDKVGRDENTLGPLSPEQLADKKRVDQSYRIIRLNLACHPDEGITIPWAEPYISIAKRVLAAQGVKVGWMFDYDWPRLEAAGAHVGGTIYDLPWACHLLQSDLPLSLGFWAPFYSRFGIDYAGSLLGAWKHLSGSDEVLYAAIDGPQTLRVGFGAVGDLVAGGMWSTFLGHVHTLMQRVLQPAHVIGVQADRVALEDFKRDLTEKASALQASVQAHVPESVKPLTGGIGNQGYARKPKPEVHTSARAVTLKGVAKKSAPSELKMALYAGAQLVEMEVERQVWYCTTCAAIDVQKRHACKKEDLIPTFAGLGPNLAWRSMQVTRWFWQEPFNPGSWQQLLKYMKHRGHTPGRAKRTGEDSTDRETLERLAKTGDPVYRLTLDLRGVSKVLSTYVIGVLKRLDGDDRFHPVPTMKPSTQRLSYRSPNITNVITERGELRAKKEGKVPLAAGFRKCIVAGTKRPSWLTEEMLREWEELYA